MVFIDEHIENMGKVNNKLIAEFMGVFHQGIFPPVTIGEQMYTLDELQYHTSWDWLMPVVKECYKHKHENALLNAHCVFISAALQTVDRKTIYETVVNFIQAYNKDDGESK